MTSLPGPPTTHRDLGKIWFGIISFLRIVCALLLMVDGAIL